MQDIEADDKLLGPLSFRQFVYSLVGVFMLYVSYLLYVHHGELLLIVTLPIAFFAAFLAFPFGKDQPTEVWAIAKLRFFLKPRKRIWAQSGVKELVTITVPKKIDIQLTNGLSQTEVESRLQALANTIDTRGWAVKNVSSVFQSPLSTVPDSDRLISSSTLPQSVPDDYTTASDDLFDESTNPIAQQVDQLLTANDSQHHQQLLDNLNSVQATPTPEKTIDQQLKAAGASNHALMNNMHTLRQPAAAKPVVKTVASPQKPASTPTPDPVIMNLSQRNDLNVNVISHEADRAKEKDNSSDEVLISLH